MIALGSIQLCNVYILPVTYMVGRGETWLPWEVFSYATNVYILPVTYIVGRGET